MMAGQSACRRSAPSKAPSARDKPACAAISSPSEILSSAAISRWRAFFSRRRRANSPAMLSVLRGVSADVVGTVYSFQGKHWLASRWLVRMDRGLIINENHSQLKFICVRQIKKRRDKRGAREPGLRETRVRKVVGGSGAGLYGGHGLGRSPGG